MTFILDLLITRIPGGPVVQGVLFGLIHSASVFIGTYAGCFLLYYSGIPFKRSFLWSLAVAPLASAWVCFRAARAVFGVPMKGVFIGCLTLGWPAVAAVGWVVFEVANVVHPVPLAGTSEELNEHFATTIRMAPALVDGSLATGWFLVSAPLAAIALHRQNG